MIHQVGKCAVAHVLANDGRAPYYITRWRQHYVEFLHISEAIPALWELRRMDNAEVRRDKELLTYADLVHALPEYKPDVLVAFWQDHGLDLAAQYTRADLRRAITSARRPSVGKYLAWLNRLTPEIIG